MQTHSSPLQVQLDSINDLEDQLKSFYPDFLADTIVQDYRSLIAFSLEVLDDISDPAFYHRLAAFVANSHGVKLPPLQP